METIRRADGLEIAFTDTRSDQRPMLFVHGMACDHTDWDKQVPFFSPTHRVVTIDLRGHGASSNPTGEFHVTEMADDVAWVIEELGLDHPVVVGHSFGGLVTLAFGSQHPTVPSALVILDTAFEMRPALANDLEQYFDSLDPETFTDYVRTYVSSRSTDPGDDPAVVEHNIQMLQAFGFERFIKMGRAILEYGDARPPAKLVTAPLLWVGSSRPFADREELKTHRPDWYYGQTVGSGHWHQVLVPDQINAMIRDFLIQVDRGFPSPPPGE